MSLRARLLVSYLLVIAVFTCIIGGVLLLLASGVLRTINFQRLNTVANTSTALVLRTQRTPQSLVERTAELREVRIFVTDGQGRVLKDSAGQTRGQRFWDQAEFDERPSGPQGTWTGQDGRAWLFVARPLPSRQDPGRQGWLIFAVPEPSRRRWFAENLLRPLLVAGGVGLLLSSLLAWLISRSVARPLQRVAEAAHAIARGDYDQTVPVSGPTEVQDMAQDFNVMARQVQASRDAQRDFVSNVSHELKTPLTSIQGYSQAILDGTAADPEAVARSATIIHQEAGRMARMASELLDLARIESGQVVMRQEPVDLGALLAHLIEGFRLRAEKAEVTLEAQLSELPPVTGDGDRLAQVFANLLDNALKHSPEGERVTIAAQQLSPSEGQGKTRLPVVEVTVSDSGEGIPPEDLPRVFERFYQVDKSRQQSGGVGLGLAIAREIVEAHGGSIRAESIVGLGTRFTVTLPVRAKD